MTLSAEVVSPFTAVLTLIAVIVATIFLTFRLHGIPCLGRGPWGLPILGFYPFLRKDVHIHLLELAKKYGDPYLLTVCGNLYLHIGNHKVYKDAFIKKGDCFQARSQEISVLGYIFKDGIPFIDGEPWRIWRKFVGQCMRELGLGPREQLQEQVLSALQSTIDALRESKAQFIDISDLLAFQCTEVVRELFLGKEISKATARKFNELYMKANILVGEKEMLLCGPVAKYLFLNKRNEGFKETMSARNDIISLLQAVVDKHRLDDDYEHPDNLVGFYLREKKKREEMNDPQAKYFDDKTFIGSLIQLYGDGSYSIGIYITCFMKDLALRPETQNEIYEEIVRVIGKERLPTYEDRMRMPYTVAVIKELERISTLFPYIATLVCNRDTTVEDVFVPKGTISIVNYYAIHHDPKVYKNPEKFDPQRFMPSNENSIPENPVPFGIGRKSCAGEQLVRFEAFMFVVAILQNFTLYAENVRAENEGDKTAEFNNILDYRFKAIPRS